MTSTSTSETRTTTDERASIAAALAAKLGTMTEALVAGRPDDVAAVYAQDGVIVGFPGPLMPFVPIFGRDQIARSWSGPPASRWTLEVLNVEVRGRQAVQHGRSILEVAGRRFDTAFMCVWRRGADGAWHIQADVFKPWTD